MTDTCLCEAHDVLALAAHHEMRRRRALRRRTAGAQCARGHRGTTYNKK
jgi:hypothetical protein